MSKDLLISMIYQIYTLLGIETPGEEESYKLLSKRTLATMLDDLFLTLFDEHKNVLDTLSQLRDRLNRLEEENDKLRGLDSESAKTSERVIRFLTVHPEYWGDFLEEEDHRTFAILASENNVLVMIKFLFTKYKSRTIMSLSKACQAYCSYIEKLDTEGGKPTIESLRDELAGAKFVIDVQNAKIQKLESELSANNGAEP